MQTIEKADRLAEGQKALTAQSPFLDLNSTVPVVLATWKNGGTFTSAELSATLNIRRPKSFADKTTAQIMSLPQKELRTAVEEVLMTRLLTQNAKDDGFTSQSPEVKVPIDNYRDIILNTLYYNRQILPEVERQEDKLREKYYNDHLKDYQVNDPLRVREIWLPYMQTYVVRKGDTWTSIAKNICDDEHAVSQFLRNDNIRFLRVPADLPSAGPVENESLLVPITPSAQKDILAKGKKLAADLMAGGDWDKLAEAAGSQSAGGVFTPETEGMNEKIVHALNTLKSGEMSDVIETSSGVHILKVETTATSHTMPFSEVKASIEVSIEESTKIREAERNKVLERLQKKYPIDIREDYLRRVDYQEMPDPLPEDTVLASADGLSYTIHDLLVDLSATQKTWKQLTPEERLKTVKMSPDVLKWLVVQDAIALGYTTNPADVSVLQDSADEALSILAYRRLLSRFSEPTESDLKKYWEDHPTQFSQPEKVKLHEITKRIDLNAPPNVLEKQIERAKKELEIVRKSITDLDSFEKAAIKNSDSIATRSRGGQLGEKLSDYRGDDFRKMLMGLQPGEVSMPVVSGAEVMIVRLDDRVTSGTEPFEQCRARVLDAWRKERNNTVYSDIQKLLFKQYEVDIKIPEK